MQVKRQKIDVKKRIRTKGCFSKAVWMRACCGGSRIGSSTVLSCPFLRSELREVSPQFGTV